MGLFYSKCPLLISISSFSPLNFHFQFVFVLLILLFALVNFYRGSKSDSWRTASQIFPKICSLKVKRKIATGKLRLTD